MLHLALASGRLHVSKVHECLVLVAADKTYTDVSSIQCHKNTKIVLHNGKLIYIFDKLLFARAIYFCVVFVEGEVKYVCG